MNYRVGNYFENFLGEIFQSNEETIKVLNGEFISEFPKPKPILLTNELLKKLVCDFSVIDMNSDIAVFSIDEKFFFSKGQIEIKYLHELQNEFYKKTGEELKLK